MRGMTKEITTTINSCSNKIEIMTIIFLVMGMVITVIIMMIIISNSLA